MSRLVHIAFLAMIVSCAAGVQASSPRLNLILPRGVQRGGEHVLTFSGANLGDAEQVLFYGEGFEVTKLEPNDKAVKVTVNVAPAVTGLILLTEINLAGHKRLSNLYGSETGRTDQQPE